MISNALWIDTIVEKLSEWGINGIEENSKSILIKTDSFNKRIHFCSLGDEIENWKPGEIIIHQDIFQNRSKQVFYRLKSICGKNAVKVHGRLTSVKQIPKNQAQPFVDENHLMGFGGGKYFLGLFYKNQLYAVGVFSRLLKMKYENPPYNSTEFERYCVLADHSVTGGIDKMISFFFENFETDDIVTTTDCEWSDGKMYEKLGFQVVSVSKALMFAVENVDFTRRIIASVLEQTSGETILYNKGAIRLQLRRN